MSTTYVPSSSGQGDAGGKTYYLRLKVDRVYDSSTQKSTLTITPQFKGGANGVTHGITGTLAVNSDTLMNLTSGNRYAFVTAGGDWVSLKNIDSGTVYSVTKEITHVDGVATARFQVSFRTADAGGTVNNEFSIDDTETYTETILGTAQIYDGSNWVECEPYVYDGSNWARCEPYVYTSNGWVKH